MPKKDLQEGLFQIDCSVLEGKYDQSGKIGDTHLLHEAIAACLHRRGSKMQCFGYISRGLFVFIQNIPNCL